MARPRVVRKHIDGRVLVQELDRDRWPFEVYLMGYGAFRPRFKGAASTLQGALEIGRKHDYCRQFRK